MHRICADQESSEDIGIRNVACHGIPNTHNAKCFQVSPCMPFVAVLQSTLEQTPLVP